MDLGQIVKDTTPYMNSAGFGALAGLTNYAAVSGLRAMGAGSSLLEEITDNRNLIVGVATAMAAGVAGHEYAQELATTIPHVLKYIGAAITGGVAGLVTLPVVSALASKDSVGTNVSTRIRNGFIAGALLLPTAYLAADLISKYF